MTLARFKSGFGRAPSQSEIASRSFMKISESNNELEYHKQLTQLHREFIKALTHSSLEIDSMAGTLENYQHVEMLLQKAVVNDKPSNQKEPSVSQSNFRSSRKICFPDSFDDVNSDDEVRDEILEDKASFFARILDDAESTKSASTKIHADFFKKFDDYKGWNLERIYKYYREKDFKKSDNLDLKSFAMPSQQPSTPKSVPPQISDQNTQTKQGIPSGPAGTLVREPSKTNPDDSKGKPAGMLGSILNKPSETGVIQPKGGLVKTELKAPAMEEKKSSDTPKPPTSMFNFTSKPAETSQSSIPNKDIKPPSTFAKRPSEEEKHEVKVPQKFATLTKSQVFSEKEEASPDLDKSFGRALGSPSGGEAKSSSFISSGDEADKVEKGKPKDQQPKVEEPPIFLNKTPVQPKMGVKSNLSVLKDLAGMDTTQPQPTQKPKPVQSTRSPQSPEITSSPQDRRPGRKAFNVADLLQNSDDDPILGDTLPPLVRDDSYISKKPEPIAGVDLFKTMSFGPPKPQTKHTTKAEAIAMLTGGSQSSSGGQSATLFTKKLEKKPNQEEQNQGSSDQPNNQPTVNLSSLNISSANPKAQEQLPSQPPSQPGFSVFNINKPQQPLFGGSQPQPGLNLGQGGAPSGGIGSSGTLFSKPGSGMDFLNKGSSTQPTNMFGIQNKGISSQSGGNMFSISWQ